MSRQTRVCREKLTVVATKSVFTKIILVAAPANDNILGSVGFFAAERVDLLMV